MLSGEFLVVSEINGKKYVPYSSYIDLQSRYERDAEERKAEFESLKIQSFHDNDTIEKFQKDFARYDEKNKALQDENNALKDRISELEIELNREKNCYLKMDGNYLWIKPNEAKLIYENHELKSRIQRLMGECGEIPKDTKTDFPINDVSDYEKLCRELQDQHQQDCVLINNLNVTIDKLVDRYANLRKNLGID